MISVSDPAILAIEIIVLLFSVVIHEVMHGLVALRFGDHTAERAGRLTLNPLPHIDLFMTILLPALLIISGAPVIGGAKPVPVNPLNFTDLRRGELFVSAAGIISNFVLALIATVLYHTLGNLFTLPFLIFTLAYTIKINLALGLFNLLPIPPLDGSRIVMSQLSYKAAQAYSQLEPFGFFILLGLLYFHILDVFWYVVLPPLYALLGLKLS